MADLDKRAERTILIDDNFLLGGHAIGLRQGYAGFAPRLIRFGVLGGVSFCAERGG
jgi:hypothetical protein